MTGFGRQPFDERVFTVAILLRQWSDQNVATVPERFYPVLAVDRGVGGRGPIIVVFDGKHGVFLQCGLQGWHGGKKVAFESFSTPLSMLESDLDQIAVPAALVCMGLM
jgi:hypothetical protein